MSLANDRNRNIAAAALAEGVGDQLGVPGLKGSVARASGTAVGYNFTVADDKGATVAQVRTRNYESVISGRLGEMQVLERMPDGKTYAMTWPVTSEGTPPSNKLGAAGELSVFNGKEFVPLDKSGRTYLPQEVTDIKAALGTVRDLAIKSPPSPSVLDSAIEATGHGPVKVAKADVPSPTATV
jgi:hypothetical protein